MRDWQKVEEVGSARAIRFTGVLLRVLPHALLVLLAYPASLFYYIFSPKARHSLSTYIENYRKATGKKLHVYPFFLAFSITLVEKGESWAGKLSADNSVISGDGVESLRSKLSEGQGAVMIFSHLGSSEEMRALSREFEKGALGKELPLVSVVDFKVSDKFSSMLKTLNPEASMNLMSIHDMDVSSIERMSGVIADGGLVAIAGDRSASRNFSLEFLGKEADFPYGAFYIPALLDAPVYFLHCVRKKTFGFRKQYAIDIKKCSAVQEGSTRKARQDYARRIAADYAVNLENMCRRYPYQWYNFFDFWSRG